MKLLLALLLFAVPGQAQTIISRRYWIVPLDTLAIGHLKHTHVETTGRVAYCRTEDDWDKHVRLWSVYWLDEFGRRRVDSLGTRLPWPPVLYTDSTRFITVEWIPTWDDSAKVWRKPIVKCPPVGSVITVWGITRRDPDHSLWAELHPAEKPWSFTIF